MRTRLLAAMLVLVIGTLVIAGVGGVLLVRQASITTGRQQLYSEARALAAVPRPLGLLTQLRRFAPIGQYHSLSIAWVSADGSFAHPLPPRLASLGADPAVLASGRAIVGNQGRLVYVFIPLHVPAATLHKVQARMPSASVGVLVATRHLQTPTDGIGWFLLVGLIAVAVAAAVAYWLASRFSRPLVTAAEATGRIADGDLQARMPLDSSDLPEFAVLATAINRMGDGLEGARHQQRHFLLSISHDLRTPLTSIRGYADAIADGTTDDVGEAVAVISAEAGRLERLVQDLLDLARLDSQHFSLHPRPVDLSDVMASTIERFRPGAAAASLELLEDRPQPGTVWAMTDPDRLIQILSNLIENAFRYARQRVAVGARTHDRTALLWVADDGPGIAPEDLSRVFEPHFTSDRRATRRSGTGLGLAIVAELAAAMGGGVRAQSPAGDEGGTVLVVWVPATGAPARSSPAPAQTGA